MGRLGINIQVGMESDTGQYRLIKRIKMIKCILWSFVIRRPRVERTEQKDSGSCQRCMCVYYLRRFEYAILLTRHCGIRLHILKELSLLSSLKYGSGDSINNEKNIVMGRFRA